MALKNIKHLEGFKWFDIIAYSLACYISISIAYLYYESSFTPNGYIPNGHDSFYHARRILDLIAGNSINFSFDSKIHAPEGSWLTWPWAYDYIIAMLVKFMSYACDIKSPMWLLVRVPPYWLFINTAIFVLVLNKLKLNNLGKGIALLFFSLSPLTQELHGFAVIDHHYVEFTFVLLVLLLGLMVSKDLDNTRNLVLLGVVLGGAPAFHNSLFILQLPVLCFFVFNWFMCGSGLQVRQLYIFSFSLILSSLLFLLPSSQFLDMQFHFYVHSWFHMYVSVCMCAVLAYISIFRRTYKNIIIVCLASIVISIPIANDIVHGVSFLSGDMLKTYGLSETQNIVTLVKAGEYWQVAERYTVLIWLSPIIIVYSIYALLKSTEKSEWYLYIFMLFGLAMLLSQLRLHYFGSVFLYLFFLYKYFSKTGKRNIYMTISLSLFLLSSMTASASSLLYSRPMSLSYDYELTRHIFMSLSELCERYPGVVLADHNDGHYIRYHTNCSVIANNMIMTKFHVSKVGFVRKLYDMRLVEVLNEAPYVKYIYLRREDNIFGISDNELYMPSKLIDELLYSDVDTGLVKEVMRINVEIEGRQEILAKLFKVNG